MNRFPYGFVVKVDKALEVFRHEKYRRQVTTRKVNESITVTKNNSAKLYSILDRLCQEKNYKKAQ